MTLCTQHLTIEHGYRLLHLTLLRHDGTIDGTLGLGKEELTVAHHTLYEGSIGLHCQLVHTAIHHLGKHSLCIVEDEVLHVTLSLIGDSLMLCIEVYDAILLLLVLSNGNDRLLIVGNGIIYTLCRICRHCKVSKDTLDLGLNLVYIHITHHYDSLLVGAIPLLVVCTQSRVREVVNHLHSTDGPTVAIAVAGIHLQ